MAFWNAKSSDRFPLKPAMALSIFYACSLAHSQSDKISAKTCWELEKAALY